MPRHGKKRVEIDSDLLPEEMKRVNPHEPLQTYFSDDVPEGLFEHFADFYEKRPKEGIEELINMLVFLTGSSEKVTAEQIKKSKFDVIKEAIKQEMEEEESPVTKYFKGTDDRAFSFWTEICNSMIVCKGLFIEPFEVFKDWAFDFCNCPVRILRESSIVAMLAIEQFLAESISRAKEELEKLKKSKNKNDQVVKRQIEVFQEELASSVDLSTDIFHNVIRHRFKDPDTKIGQLCLQIMGKAGIDAPEDFGDPNITKYIGNMLKSENTKLRREALKQARNFLNKGVYQPVYDPFLKSIIPTLRDLCSDYDNGIAIGAMDLLTKIGEKDIIEFDADDFDSVFSLVIDDAPNVRATAAKFFSSVIFKTEKPKKKGKASSIAAIKEQNEKHIRQFCEMSKDFGDFELQLAVDSFWGVIDGLRDWDLICQIILAEEGDRVYPKVLGMSALKVDDKDEAVNLTLAMMTHLTKLFEMYQDDQQVMVWLVSIPQKIRIEAITSGGGDRQFKNLLEKLHTIFTDCNEKDLYIRALNAIHTWSKGTGKLAQLAEKEFTKIANDFKKNVKKFDATKMAKFSAVVAWHDYSEEKKIREFLQDAVESDDVEYAVSALESLGVIVKWDALRLRSASEDARLDYEVSQFRVLQDLFGSKLSSESVEIREAAFHSLSTLWSLVGFTVASRPLDVIDDIMVDAFFYAFHDLDNKSALFESLTRPIVNHSVDTKFSVHVLWYLQDASLKASVQDFIKKMKDDIPFQGYELGRLLRTRPFSVGKLKPAMKTMAKYVVARTAVDSWLDVPDDMYLPLFRPFLEMMTPDNAELLVKRAKGARQIAHVLEMRRIGAQLTAKDFVVAEDKPKKSTHRRQQTADEDDSADVESASEDQETEDSE